MMSLNFKCITLLAFLIVRCYVLSLSAKLNIERGERDVFDNPKCGDPSGVGCSCGGLNAYCVDSTCKRCICSSTHGTFLPSNDTTGNGQCAKNRRLLSIARSASCNVKTNKGECCVFPFQYSNKQYYSCATVGSSGTPWCATTSNYDRDRKWGYCNGEYDCYNFANPSSAILVTDARNCSQQYLRTDEIEREISIPYESKESMCFVVWDKLRYLDNNAWKQLLFRDEIFTIYKRNKMTFLKLNFTKTTNDLTGLIVNLNFYCARQRLTPGNIADIKCIVIKFRGTAIYPPTVKPTISTLSTTQKVPTTPSNTSNSTENTSISTEDPTNATISTATVTDTKPITNYQITSPTSTSISSTDTISSPTGAAKNQKSDSSSVTIIAVCVVIAILILCGILGFVFYKRRRRTEQSDNAAIKSRHVHAKPVVTFRTSSVSDDCGYEIPYIKKTVSSGQAGALAAEPQHQKRWNNRDVEDKKVIDDPDYVIPAVKNRGYEIPSRPDVKNTLSPGALYAEPESEKGDDGGYIKPIDMEDELGYVIPADTTKTTLGKDNDSSTLKGDTRDSDEDGHYQSLGEERYEHVYQGLLPTTNR